MATESSCKRSKLSPRNLCVICFCGHDDTEFSFDKFNIFIVDLNGDASEEYVKTRPSIRLQGLGDDCFFCGLGSDLYMFKESGKRPVYKFNLEGHESSSSLVLDETSVEDSVVSFMPYRKQSPRTIPTPDGKIIVLSNNIYFYYPVMFEEDEEDEEDDDVKSHSQMFDPIANVWEDLPELCIRQDDPGNFEMLDGSGSWKRIPQSTYWGTGRRREAYGQFFHISAYCFIDESTLLVRIMSEHFGVEGHLLTLNIQSLNQGWKFYDGWQFLRSYIRQHRFMDELLIVENRVAFDTLGGSSNTHGDFLFPRSVLFPRGVFEFGRWSQDIVLTDYVEDRECSFAIISTEPVLDEVHRPSSLVVDEFKYELKQGICTPKISTPFKFRVSESSDWLIITNSFMLSPPPFPFKRQ